MSLEDPTAASLSTLYTGSPPAGPDNADAAGAAEDLLEPLACVTCRSRKLKCDRTKPACTRCTKFKSSCVYPEARRKPAMKRRNVKELEERLAQVEVLLNKAAAGNHPETIRERTDLPRAQGHQSRRSTDGNGGATRDVPATSPPRGVAIPIDLPMMMSGDGMGEPMSWGFETVLVGAGGVGNDVDNDPQPAPPPMAWEAPSAYTQSFHQSSSNGVPLKPANDVGGGMGFELLGLGMFEALPPSEMIEELHKTFFVKQHPLIPVIHPGRYLQSFYSAPHLRPPMALQYAVWTMATNGHDKYSQYHDAFHRRCRQYLQEDELRDDGEHFLTVAHAQAWALIATDEARCMSFTRAAMSAARCIKLIHMMGLHRLDDPQAEFEMAPTIVPPKDWTELEERRRVFWGAFCIDSHAAISTGWPTLISPVEITTRLPSSEDAFNSCNEEETCRLDDVFTGASYSSFAVAGIVCHIFNRIMKHVHHPRPEDRPSDLEYGPYWTRHRELDNMISSLFMFLPERFRLPNNVRDPVAVHANLNLHASVICLHNSAYEMAEEHNLPGSLKQALRARLQGAASEVVAIVKMTAAQHHGYRSPLVALALYVASSVYISQAENGSFKPTAKTDLEFLLTAMEAIGKQHSITMSFLRQAIFDLRQAGLGEVRAPNVAMFEAALPGLSRNELVACGHNIPLFARSRVSRSGGIMSPLPGRLPLKNPMGRRNMFTTAINTPCPVFPENQAKGSNQAAQASTGFYNCNDGNANVNKRRRVSDPSADPHDGLSRWSVEEVSSDTTPQESSLASGSNDIGDATRRQRSRADGTEQVRLPHRGGSSTNSSSPSANLNVGSNRTTTPTSAGISPVKRSSVLDGGIVLTDQSMDNGSLFEAENRAAAQAEAPAAGGVDMNLFEDLNAWGVPGERVQDASALYAQMTEAMLEDNSWMMRM